MLTNKFDLPDFLVDALTADTYDSGESNVSVTQLLRPPQMAYLQAKHPDLEEVGDVTDKVWTILGSAGHYVLERMTGDNLMKEKRLYTTAAYCFPRHRVVDSYLSYSPWLKIGGQIDLYDRDTKTIYDFKFTSAFSFALGDKPEWEAQLNMYAQLMRDNGYPVESIKIIAILRDWTKYQMMKSHTYPRSPVIIKDIPLWDEETTVDFMMERVIDYFEARQGNYPRCTPDERWERPHKWALMKKGRKSAVRLLDSIEEAERMLDEYGQGGDYYIKHRMPESVRCESYCPYREVCEQNAERKDLIANLKG